MTFNTDDYPGAPRILFIGWPNSVHTHSWIELLHGGNFNIRLFGLPGDPPAGWPVRSYLFGIPGKNGPTRRYPLGHLRLLVSKIADVVPYPSFNRFGRHAQSLRWLKRVVDQWKPHVIHTLGFEPASYFYLAGRDTFSWRKSRWVAQARGGPDLHLFRHIPDLRTKMEQVIRSCDFFIADNQWNYGFAESLGLKQSQKTPFGIVSGPGGTEVEEYARNGETPPSRRERVIYMPKCYDNMAVRGHAALEGLRLAWPQIQPCKVVFSWITQPDFRPWVRACLGEEILAHCELHEEIIPKQESIAAMQRARVLYAPSVLDGIPNSMLEAMACGAFPIVSPLESIDGVVEDETNVLLARNLYPEELAKALVRAMNDDALVDTAAANNRSLVNRISNRNQVRETARSFYSSIAEGDFK